LTGRTGNSFGSLQAAAAMETPAYIRVRMDRFSRDTQPFQRNFSLLSALGTMDLILFHAILPAMFFIYALSCISYYGSFLWVILIGVNASTSPQPPLFYLCSRYGRPTTDTSL